MNTEDIFRSIGRLLLTRKTTRSLKETISSAGKTLDVEVFTGFYIAGSFILGILLSLALDWWPGFFASFYQFVYQFVAMDPIFVFIFLFILSELITFLTIGILVYVILNLSVESRTKAVETALPDYLMYVSANVKSGMPLDQAIWYAAKPEFGILSNEIKRTMKKSFGSQPLEESLNELSKSFKSDIFNRTIMLLKQAIATGSEVAEVLDRTSEDARDSLLLRKEIEASLVLYEIFVLFASMVGTPFLFAVSAKLVTILEKVFPQVPNVSMDQLLGMIKPAVAPIVTSSQFFWFTMGVLIVTSFFSSMIIGAIKSGSRMQGLKYFPFILVIAVIVYQVVITLLDTFFSNVLL